MYRAKVTFQNLHVAWLDRGVEHAWSTGIDASTRTLRVPDDVAGVEIAAPFEALVEFVITPVLVAEPERALTYDTPLGPVPISETFRVVVRSPDARKGADSLAGAFAVDHVVEAPRFDWPRIRGDLEASVASTSYRSLRRLWAHAGELGTVEED